MSGLRRVVVTGLGTVSPLGVGAALSWKNLLAGKSGIKKLDKFASMPCEVAGSVPRGKAAGEYDESLVAKEFRNSTSDFIKYALIAAHEAMKDSGYQPATDEQRERMGVAVGSAIGDVEEYRAASEILFQDGLRKVSPFVVPKMLSNMAAGNISISLGLRGPNHCVSTACAAGTHAVGDAFRFIQMGDADVMIAGGAECANSVPVCAFFARAKALCMDYSDDEPARASRPFDKTRAGFVLAEGAACLVLEEYEHAKKRGADIYAEVLGYGLSGDAHHITAPSPDGRGALLAMKTALRHACVEPGLIDYVNAHATSTPLGDAVENSAIQSLVDKGRVRVSSTKGATGHMLGAAGAIEAMFSVLALKHGVAPATLHLQNVDQGFDLNYVPHVPQDVKMKYALSNSFGFGGTNGSVLFGKLS